MQTILEQFEKKGKVQYQCFKFLSSIIFTLLFKGFYVLLFLALAVIYCALTPIFKSASPCRLDALIIGIILGIVLLFVVTSLALVVISIIVRVPDVYLIRVEIVCDCICFLIYLAVSVVMLIIGFSQASNIVAGIGPAVYVMFNIVITAIIPALRTFKKYEEPDIHTLDTWLHNDSLRALFKVCARTQVTPTHQTYCKQELAIENIIFYEKCIEYKHLPVKSVQAVDAIISQFLTPNSVMEINVNSKSIANIVRKQYITLAR